MKLEPKGAKVLNTVELKAAKARVIGNRAEAELEPRPASNVRK